MLTPWAGATQEFYRVTPVFELDANYPPEHRGNQQRPALAGLCFDLKSLDKLRR
ncbi:MAG: hypothetical protein IPH10_13805 [bacterium]|nr:hypothetical protein [bacterium]